MTSRRILTSSSNCTSRKEEEGEMKGKSLCLLTLKLDIVLYENPTHLAPGITVLIPQTNHPFS